MNAMQEGLKGNAKNGLNGVRSRTAFCDQKLSSKLLTNFFAWFRSFDKDIALMATICEFSPWTTEDER